jgi:2-dehydro-3-deoxyphosphogluconate aldolase/(4S)-4-hydroxy-2-oxoglutarate aldolase
MDLLAKLGELGVFPVVKISDADHAIPMAEALLKGNMPCAEVTFRTKAAEESIRRIALMKSGMLVGAGTVLSIKQAEQAVSAGARFIVSPGFNPLVVDWCLENGITVIPGIATPSEVLQALNRGLSILKLFPAEALGGIPYLEAMTPALPEIKFIPTGGISAANMSAWLKLPCVHAVAGSWIVQPRMLAEEAFGEVTRLAAEAVANVKIARQKTEAK